VSAYVFDQSGDKELDRLRGLESLFDPNSKQRLADLGVSDGWQCLEVGCGAGSIALWLAEQVGSTGRVVAVDLDPRFFQGHDRIQGHDRANLDVRQHDILTDRLEDSTGRLEDSSFDLVHARAVLEHLSDPQRALERMVSAVRPGGWVMVEDSDLGGVPAQPRYIDPPELAAVDQRITRATEAVFAAVGANASFGARLIGALNDAGLKNIAGVVHTPIVSGGTENLTRISIEEIGEHLISTGLVTASDLELFLTLIADRSCHYPLFSLVTAWGQRS
jgi:SAM-dependent methyltransferase